MKEKLDLVIERIKEVTKKECYSFKIVEGKPNITDTKLGGVPMNIRLMKKGIF